VAAASSNHLDCRPEAAERGVHTGEGPERRIDPPDSLLRTSPEGARLDQLGVTLEQVFDPHRFGVTA
jgi:hypothetical protein